MSFKSGPPPVSTGSGIAGARRRGILALALLLLLSVALSGSVSLADAKQQEILYPVLMSVIIVAAFSLALFLRDGNGLFFHAGFWCAGTSLIYIALPPIFFLLAGSEWTDLSDARLRSLNIDEDDIREFVQSGSIYLGSFCAVYLIATSYCKRVPVGFSTPASNIEMVSCAVILAVFVAFQLAIEFTFGVSLNQSNVDLATDPASQHLPLIVSQFAHNVMAIQYLAKIALIVTLVSWWRNWWARSILAIWLAGELLNTVLLSGPRTYFAYLLMATVFAFHKLVRPLSFAFLGFTSVAFLALLLAYGYLRDYEDSANAISASFATANEFQVLMGTALHVRQLIEDGVTAPAAALWSELLMLVPQQLIPMDKIDPAYWYLDVSGLSESGGGYMFGVLSQAEIGWGNTELAIRGSALALLLAFIHWQYVRHSSSLVATVCYIWLLIIIYYSFRAGTFYWVYFAIFQLLPFVGMFLMLRYFIGRLANGTGQSGLLTTATRHVR